MELLLIFALGVLVGVLAARRRRRRKAEGGAGQAGRRWEDSDGNKARLLHAFVSRGRMAKDSAAEILNVSEETATRYLEELERDGRVRRLGTTGRGVYYERAER